MYQNSIDHIKAIGDVIADSVSKNIFPVETNDRILDIEKIDKLSLSDIYDNSFNINKHLDAKLKGRDLTVPMKATLVLKDKKTGNVIDRKKVTLIDQPIMTNRGSFIYGGNDYHMVNQLRLKPGVYTRVKENGEVESFFNLSKGGASGFSIWMDPESGKINFKIGGKNPSLYATMKALDVSDAELESKWGKELLDLNKLSDKQLNNDISKIYNSLYRSKADPNADINTMKSEIKNFFDNTGISEETTKITLGKSFDKVTPELLLRSSDKLIKVSKNEEEPDERDALEFKNVFSVEDLISARINAKAREAKFKIKNNLNSKDSISDIYSKEILNKPIRSFMTQSSLSTSSDQTNPLAMVNAMTRVTPMGEGGISSLDIITTSMRSVSDSHAGALDPTQTPESKRIGINLNLTGSARVEDREIKVPLIDIKTGKESYKTKLETHESYVAFPDQYDIKNKKFNFPKVRAIYKGKTVETEPENISYIIRDASDLFSIGTNLIPFVADVQGNRTMLANKMSGQAISLANREAPLVQVKLNNPFTTPDGFKVDTEEKAAARIFALKSPVNGKVLNVTKDYVEIAPDDGSKAIKIYKYDHFPLANKSYMHADFIVKPGDILKQHQLLAEDNYTKDGTLALGTNLNVAYLPYKDKTFEDGIVISESAAKKLTSQHLHVYKTSYGDKDKLGINTYAQQYPMQITGEQQKKLDSRGIIKPGETVMPGDTLVALLHYREPTETDAALGKLSKTLLSKYGDGGIKYDHDSPGIVERVTDFGGEITVHVSTNKAAEAGDKLVGRYGNKGIITEILPDSEMPVTDNGAKAEIIMSPYGVPGRINVGQIYETIAGKAALARGRPIKITNMDPNIKSDEELERLAKRYNIKTQEAMFDPKTGRKLADTSFGPQYIYKLTHMVEKKMASRSPYSAYNSDEQPAKGGGTSARSLDRLTWNSLIAHGARENLAEMATYKSSKNPEFWNKIRLGLPVPAPQTPFATDKLFALMQAAGVNIKKNGQMMQLAPMTDDEILQQSNGEIDDAQVMMAKTLRPIKDGLFDDAKTGGINGKRWTHIKLHEPVVSPIMAPAAQTLLGLTDKKFNSIISGDSYLDPNTFEVLSEKRDNALTGGMAIKQALSQIDPKAELEKLKAESAGLSGDKLDKANKKMRYLKALADNNMTPDKAYIINNLPVLPPQMRPIYSLPDGSLSTSPINFLYRDLIMVNKELKAAENLPEFAKKALRKDLFEAAKAVQGLGDPIIARGEKKVIGALETIKGDQPKTGYFQSVVFSKKQELTGQSTAAPSVDVSPDEVMLPKAMAWNLFEPFIHKELTNMGFSNMQAKKMIQDKDPKAETAMQRVAENRPVWVNRAPSLHKLNMLAMYPKLYDGSSIKVNPLIVGGFNLDFDGDCIIGSVFAAIDISKIKNLTSTYNSDIPIEEFINQRSVGMPSKNLIVMLSESERIVHLNLEDFPRIESSKKITEKGTLLYEVPDGMSVFTLDNDNRTLVKCKVTHFSIHPNLDSYIVTTNSSQTLHLSDDHSAIIYDFKTGMLKPEKPTNLMGKALPIIKNYTLKNSLVSDVRSDVQLTSCSSTANIKQSVKLTEGLGFFIGMMVGDGWVSDKGYGPASLHIATVYPELKAIFESEINNMLPKEQQAYSIASAHEFEGKACYSMKHTIGNKSLAHNVVEWIGKGAGNKHLPVWFLNTSEDFRLGLLAGLIDTDGSAGFVQAKAKVNKQFQISYHTKSARLAYEVRTLCKSLGIRTSSTVYKDQYYNISLYMSDALRVDIPLKKLSHKQSWDEYRSSSKSKASVDKLEKTDLVPFDVSLFDMYKPLLPGATRKKDRDGYEFLLYNTMRNSVVSGCITRTKAREIVAYTGKATPEWQKLIDDETVQWTYVKKVTKVLKKETMYDITVPGPYTFTTIDGIVIQDTLGVYVPASQAAVNESKRFTPSQILDDPRDYGVTLKPSHDIQLGLFALSSKGKKRLDIKFGSLKEAEQAFLRNEIDLTDVILINSYETTFGREKLREVLPPGVRIPENGINKSALDSFFREVADADKANVNKRYADIARVAAEYNTSSGIGLTLHDLKSDPDFMAPFKSKLKNEFSKLNNNIDKTKMLSDIVSDFGKKSKQWIGDNVWKNNLATMSAAAGKPGVDQVKQLKFAPIAVSDEEGKLVPIPVTRSYSQGITSSDFWVTASGARKGMIDRALQTAEPGYYAKQLISVAVDQVVSQNDCGTKNGIELDLSRNKRDILWRYDMSGQLIDNKHYEELLRSGKNTIKVRSPITCEANEGVCQKCFGTQPNGNPTEIGANVGTEAGQVATERTTQLTMKTFHSGSVATAGPSLASGFARLQQLSHFPDYIKDRATLAKHDGTVTDIKPNPAGGMNVWIGDEKHFCPVSQLKVKLGDKVTQGDALSEGAIKPQELLATKGIRATQDYLIDAMNNTFADQGVDLNRRAFETIVRATTNVTKVTDANDSEEFLPGDKVQLTKVLAYNRMHPDKPVSHEPELLGIDFSSKVTNDWAAKLNTNRLKTIMQQGVASGDVSQMHSYNPVAPYIIGKTFGKGEKGQY